MEIFQISKSFPIDEKYSLTDQIRRSSRSVASNIAEAFRLRRYPKSFVSRLSNAESEASETQTWLEFALSCKYISAAQFNEFDKRYNDLIGMLVNMILHPEKWAFKTT